MAKYNRKRLDPLPERLRKRSTRTGRYICRCGRGYGSNYDGLCRDCRGGVSAWEAMQQEESK